MLEANKSQWFEHIFAAYNRNLLKRRFNSFKASGLEKLRDKKPDVPLILYCNHSSWWDGLIAFQISRRCGLDSYIMMEEKHLKKLFLFRKLGAFSVVREQPRQAIESINYSAKILKSDSRRTLWIFPQGEILPNDTRPIRFYNGLSRITEKLGECQTAAAAMRYEFGSEFKPSIFVKISEIKTIKNIDRAQTKTATTAFARNLTENLDELKNDIAANNIADYVDLLR